MTTASTAPSSLKPFVPQNLSANPIFCEKVTINQAEYDYAKHLGLLTVDGQMKYLNSGGVIKMSWT